MNKKYFKWISILILLIILLIISILASLSIGEINFSITELFEYLSKKTGIEYSIISNNRIPRIVLGIAVGGALSLSGVLLQGIYRNPLVEPYTLGISGGAALGVSAAIALGIDTVLGRYILPVSGFFGALIVLFLVYFLAVKKRHFSINRMLLIGVMVSFMTASLIMFLLSTTSVEKVNNIIFWTMGSLDEPDFMLTQIVLYITLLGLIISYLFSKSLNALRLGEVNAKHLGINTGIAIRILFIVASLLTGICVAVAGVIGFVGLIIPHILRLLIGSDYRILLPASFIGGSIFIINCDIVSRTIIAPNELPIGVITGIIGGVVFILVLSKSKIKID